MLHIRTTNHSGLITKRKIALHIFVGTSLLIPVVNAIIGIILRRFFPHFHPYIVPKPDTPSDQNSDPEIPLNLLPDQNVENSTSATFQDLSDQLILKIFKNLDIYQLGPISTLSKSIHAIANEQTLWKKWAGRLKMPIKQGLAPRETLKKVLTYFKIDPSTKLLQTLKKSKDPSKEDSTIKAALANYPLKACVMALSDRPDYFHFYYNDSSNQVIELKNINKTHRFSFNLKKTETYIADSQYIKLQIE